MNADQFYQFCNSKGACKEGLSWITGKSLKEFWDTSKRSDWMMWLIVNSNNNAPDKELRLIAVECARAVQHLMKDRRSVNALDVAERFANGEAAQEELDAARDAAGDAARDAAGAAARDAAWAAAWAVARDAAGAAARDAAGAAAWAAARDAAGAAAWDAAGAAAWAAAGAAAWDAAGAAAWDAAGAAARDAAWAAAGAAARDAQSDIIRKHITELIITE